jgi:predicted DNA-binding protein (MmcQ/YjbR family)
MPKDAAARVHSELVRFALGYPGAWEDHPWGETVAKVKTKVFVFFGKSLDGFGLSVKLPQSGTFALGLDWVAPTGYGLGKSAWVTATFGPRVKPPVEVLKKWIDESYRAVAPSTLVRELDGGADAKPRPRPKPKPKPRPRPKPKPKPPRARAKATTTRSRSRS